VGATAGADRRSATRSLTTALEMYDKGAADGKRAYTVAEIADVIGVGRATLYRHLGKG
jgi:predicted transcriptional regulator YheO